MADPVRSQGSMTFSSSARRTASRALVGCVLLAGVSSAASAQRKEEVVQAGKPFAAFSASAHNIRDSIVSLARAQVGTRYVRGGTSPDRGFDCSGLVRYVLSALQV